MTPAGEGWSGVWAVLSLRKNIRDITLSFAGLLMQIPVNNFQFPASLWIYALFSELTYWMACSATFIIPPVPYMIFLHSNRLPFKSLSVQDFYYP